MSHSDFCNFLQTIGIRRETGQKLWEGNIRSPQELASIETTKLTELVDDPVLVNIVYPVLHKYAFPITMSPDPCGKAIALLKKHEDKIVNPPVVTDGVQSDAVPINAGTIAEGHPQSTNQTLTTQSTYQTSANIIDTPQRTNDQGDKKTFFINGGNFNQANICGDAPVTYNNTGTTIQAISVAETPEERMQRRKIKLDPSLISIKDFTFSTSTLRFEEEPEYWPDDNVVVKMGHQNYEMLITDSNIYPVNPWNSNHALIINVTKFTNEAARGGADVDARQLEDVLKQLGFQVTLCLDKKESEIQQSLSEFRKKMGSSNPSMSLVFIGSHGDQKSKNDRFLSSDGKAIEVSEVIESFNGRHSPRLVGKPKLFFFQFCRQDSDSIRRSETNVIAQPAQNDADMLQSFATAAGTKAYRDVKEGSWFVTALCKTLKKYAHSEDLLSMMTRVNHGVKANNDLENGEVAVQLASFNSTLCKNEKLQNHMMTYLDPCLRECS